ncbi:MAG: hypothetical protein ABI599_02165 [Flavobacteriales bacterium]
MMENKVQKEAPGLVLEQGAERKKPDRGAVARATREHLSEGERVRLENSVRAWKARWE